MGKRRQNPPHSKASPSFTLNLMPLRSYSPYRTVFRSLWQPVEEQFRFRGIVSRPGVPDLDALDHPVAPAKVDRPCSAAGIDPVPDCDLFIGAVAVMDHNA